MSSQLLFHLLPVNQVIFKESFLCKLNMEVSEARRLKALEEENRRLKKLLAEQMLDNAALKDVLSRKWQGQQARGPSFSI